MKIVAMFCNLLVSFSGSRDVMLRNAEVLGLLVPDFFSIFFFFFDRPTQNQETHSSANKKERDDLIVNLVPRAFYQGKGPGNEVA